MRTITSGNAAIVRNRDCRFEFRYFVLRMRVTGVGETTRLRSIEFEEHATSFERLAGVN